jgi:hypothetical protein
VTPVGLEVSQSWGLWPWKRESAPDATRDLEMGRLVLSSLPGQEYHGQIILTSGGLVTSMHCGGDSLQM